MTEARVNVTDCKNIEDIDQDLLQCYFLGSPHSFISEYHCLTCSQVLCSLDR
jgi:hypothetical protein